MGRGRGASRRRAVGGIRGRKGPSRGGHRGPSKRRRIDEMEEKHLIDTYDADDGRVHVVRDTSENGYTPSQKISGADSGSDRETTSSSESEQEDAFHSLLTELNGKVVKHNKRSFKGSDEDEESQSDADSDEDLAEEQDDALEEDDDTEHSRDDTHADTGSEGDESPMPVNTVDRDQGSTTKGRTHKLRENAEMKNKRKGEKREDEDVGQQTSDEDEGNGVDAGEDSSSDEEGGDTNYLSHLEWEPDERVFPPEPYQLQPGSPQPWPQLGLVKVQQPTKEIKGAPLIPLKPDGKANLKKILLDNLQEVLDLQSGFEKGIGPKTKLSAYEESLLNVLNSYRDFFCPEHTWERAESLRLCYTLHVMNHVLRSRTRSVKHSMKIRKSGGTAEYQDQGLTRVKALIVLPFKNSAYRVIKLILKMVKEIKLRVLNEDRFEEEFRPPDDDESKPGKKPEDYYKFFEGDNDDMFRIGLRFSKRRVKLYSDFYSADLVIASPVGLRAIIGSEGDEKRDFDFMSSIEIVVLDQTDVFFMQNWEHIIDLFKHLNVKPRESHGVDFSRVRTWCVSEWGKYFRQNIILSQVQHPQINALVKRYNFNYRGLVSTCNKTASAAIAQVVVQVPHIFRSFEPSSAAAVNDCRFEFFTNELLPQLMKDKLLSHCLIFVRQYFDFVRLRNYMRDLADRDAGFKFTQICEYTDTGKVARARYMFFHGKRKFLLYTERFHFFHRYVIKGIRHIIFYELPTYPHLYSELVSMMSPTNQYKLPSGMESTFTTTTLYCKYDALALLPVLGDQRTSWVVHKRDKKVHLFTRD